MKEQDAEIQEFQAYLEAEAKSQNKDPKSYIENLGEEGLKKAYQRFQDWKQKKTKKAAHGLKLNYIKQLKNQCEDGEVLVYYKTGGSIGCKCMKAQSGTELTNSASSHGGFNMSPEEREKFKRGLNQNRGGIQKEVIQRKLWKKSKPKASTLPNTNNTPAKATPIPPSSNPSKHNNKVVYAQAGTSVGAGANIGTVIGEYILGDPYNRNNYVGATGKVIYRQPHPLEPHDIVKKIFLPGGARLIQDIDTYRQGVPADTTYYFRHANGKTDIYNPAQKDDTANWERFRRADKAFKDALEQAKKQGIDTTKIYDYRDSYFNKPR